MNIVYSRQPFPTATKKSIFLAGPTPRSSLVQSWRPQAVEMLRALGFDGDVYVPEDSSGSPKFDYMDQVDWEEEGLRRADCIVFWIPRVLETMPALVTNDEWGFWKNSGKVVLGTPEGAAKVRYQRHYAEKLGVPASDTLAATLMSAMTMVGDGAERSGGECFVPAQIWRTESFQRWYKMLTGAGNRIDDARVEWAYRVGPKKMPFLFSIWFSIHVGVEGRNKSNEVVIFRPDISSVVMHGRPTPYSAAIEIVLVREFRSPGANTAGFVYELPGGSAKTDMDPCLLAAEEVHEETGLTIDPKRLRPVRTRQLAATLSAHRGAVYAVELTEAELSTLRTDVDAHGIEGDSERTFVEVRTLGEILAKELVDWSTLGMILQAVG